jgi:hypothetical protein
MAYAFAKLIWEETLKEFLLHLQASRAPKTVRFYGVCIRGLSAWANENDVALDEFGKRHLDRYLAMRIAAGRKPLTVYHDAMGAKVFLPDFGLVIPPVFGLVLCR